MTRIVTFGQEPEPVVDPLNELTQAQYDFLQRRQQGADTIDAPNQSGLGRFTGPAYPFGPSWALTLGPKSDLEVVFTSVVNIITNVSGTVPYKPRVGSQVPNMVFEPNDAVTRGLIRYFTEKDLNEQEPRAQVLMVRTITPSDEPHTVIVTVAFRILGDPEGRVFSAPLEFDTLQFAA